MYVNALVSTLRKILLFLIKNRLSHILHTYRFDEHRDNNTPTIFPTILNSRILSESALLINTHHCGIGSKIQNRIEDIIRIQTDVITQQETSTNSWNYWKRESFEYQKNPYPDDLDDTCNAHYIFLVQEYLKNVKAHIGNTPFARYFNPKKTFNFTNQLLRSEIKFKTANEGTIYETSDGTIHCSAYNTWIQGSTRQDMEDIDPVVQVILYKVLSILKSIPENFKIFIEQKISRMSTELWDSKYYHSKLYVLSELSSLPFDELVANTPHIKVQEVLIESYINMFFICFTDRNSIHKNFIFI